MKMLPEHQNRLLENMATLNYLDGEGLLNRRKRRLVDERFLFVGLGGTGQEAMCEIKRTLERNVIHADLADRTSFIAIDTAHNELDAKVKKGLLKQTEVIKLPYSETQAAIAQYPEHAGNASNIQWLSRDEHIQGAHQGTGHNFTNGYYDPNTGETKSFRGRPPAAPEAKELSNPVVKAQLQGRSQSSGLGNASDSKAKGVER